MQQPPQAQPRKTDALSAQDIKTVIKIADMPEEMQQRAMDVARQAAEKNNLEKDIASSIKREFDKKYSPFWHCVVGSNFGSYVTHQPKHFAYFTVGPASVLLFKAAAHPDELN